MLLAANVLSGAFVRGAPVPTACFEFAAEESGNSIGFLFEFSFGEVDDAVAGCFQGQVGGAFVGISVGAAGAVDLDGETLVSPPFSAAADIRPTLVWSKA